MRRAPLCAALLAALLVSGCEMSGPGMTSVLGGAVNVAAPAGFCIDSRASRPADGFVTVASCARLGRSGNLPLEDGILIYQVGTAGTALVAGGEAELTSFLKTTDGRRLLSQGGNADDIKIGAVAPSRGAVTVYFTDAGAPVVEGLGNQEWRVFLDIGDRLVTIAIRGYANRPLSRAQGENLLVSAIVAFKAANGG